jgi:uncharacterized repeat protein (TIGR01451 family)
LPVYSSLTYVVTAPLLADFTGPLTYSAGALVPPGFNDLKPANNRVVLNLPASTLPSADLAVALSSQPNPAPSEEPIVYAVSVQNRGPGTAAGAAFTYTVPPGSTVKNVDAPASWSCAPPAPKTSAVTCTYVPMPATRGVPPADLPDVRITVQPPPESTDIITSVTVTGQGIVDPNPANNTATNDTLIGTFPPADISVAINGTPNPATPDVPISFDVRLTNQGPNPATGAALTFFVPIGSTVKSYDNAAAGWACTSIESSVSCTYGQNFPAGPLPPVTITLLPDPLATSIKVTANGRGRGIADSDPTNNTATEVVPISVTPPVANLFLTVTTSPAEARLHEPVIYDFAVANQGPDAATGAILTFDIPTGGTLQSITAPTGWSCIELAEQNQVSCWYSGTIDANSAAPDVQVTILPKLGISQLDAQAKVTAKGAADPNPADNLVATTTPLANYKLTGGGLGCQAAPGSGPAGAAGSPKSPRSVLGGGFFGALLGLWAMRRRRARTLRIYQ